MVWLLDAVEGPDVLIRDDDLLGHFEMVVSHILDVVHVLGRRGLALLVQSGHSSLVIELGLLLLLEVVSVASIRLVRVGSARRWRVDPGRLRVCRRDIVHFEHWNLRQIPYIFLSDYLFADSLLLRVVIGLSTFSDV